MPSTLLPAIALILFLAFILAYLVFHWRFHVKRTRLDSFDGRGNMIGRQAGMPDAKRLMEQLIEIGPVFQKLDQSEIYVNWR